MSPSSISPAGSDAESDAESDASDDTDNSAHIQPPPAKSVASLNTHDMPTFHGYWHGRDIDDFHRLGLLDADQAERERVTRRRSCERTATRLIEYGFLAPASPGGESDAPTGEPPSESLDESPAGGDNPVADEPGRLGAIACALLEYLAASDAEMMLVSLEDLWLAPLAHNVPGTTHEHPNWRRRISRRLQDIAGDEQIVATLQAIAERRRSR